MFYPRIKMVVVVKWWMKNIDVVDGFIKIILFYLIVACHHSSVLDSNTNLLRTNVIDWVMG